MDDRVSPDLRTCFTRKRARRALVWALALLLCGQLALNLFIDRCRPALRDPEFADRLALLRSQLRHHPGSPLLLFLGSSRVKLGLNPLVLDHSPSQHSEQVITFNFGLNATGPVYELFTLKRLLTEGIRPRWLGIEIHPGLLNQDESCNETLWMPSERLPWQYASLIHRHVAHPWLLDLQWLKARSAPIYSCRWTLLTSYLPAWVPADVLHRELVNNPPVNAAGSQEMKKTPTRAARQKVTEATQRNDEPRLAHFHLTSGPDRALHTVLDICRQDQITPLLILMPEGSNFRSWYRLGAREEVCAYVQHLAQEYRATVVDAWHWLPDHAFIDGHHLLEPGAIQFTRRLDAEVLQPLIHGKLVLASVPAAKPPS